MSNVFDGEDPAIFQNIPERDLVEMAIDLDIAVPSHFDRFDLLEECIRAILARAKSEGLPFSPYDADDLAMLPQSDLEALGRAVGITGEVSVAKVLKKGRRVYKLYQRHRPGNPTALLLPTLLPFVARAAANWRIE